MKELTRNYLTEQLKVRHELLGEVCKECMRQEKRYQRARTKEEEQELLAHLHSAHEVRRMIIDQVEGIESLLKIGISKVVVVDECEQI